MPPPSKKRRMADGNGRGNREAGSPGSVDDVGLGMGADPDEEEEEGEDLLDDAALARDYRAIPELDNYDDKDIDYREHDLMDHATRMKVEGLLDDRDEMNAVRRGRRPLALDDEIDEDEEDEEEARLEEERRRRKMIEQEAGNMVDEDYDEDEAPFNLENFEVSLQEWIAKDKPRREISRRFRSFLKTFVDMKGRSVYQEKIMAMCTANEQSLEVSYMDLSSAVPNLAIWLADAPKDMISVFDEVAKEEVSRQFPDYADTHESIYVRITQLPIADSIRDLRQVHLNALIKVTGVVTRRTSVFPQMIWAKYKCAKCGHVMGPFACDGNNSVSIGQCADCMGKGPFITDTEQTVYRNYQKVSLQESPGTVPAGRVPRYKEVILTADLIDRAKPGEEVEITGVYLNQFDAGLNTKQGFPVFSTLIEANHLRKQSDLSADQLLTQEDKEAILELAKDPNIGKRIIQSIAPSIYGCEHVKTAIAMSLFGGQEKNLNEKHRIRGDINVLLLGDPGTAKSQCLKYVEKTAPRAVYTTGKGASAVGLTAAVHKDPLTREWTLEGGALVLADRGVCMIDEFDKMNDKDRTSIHEAMEQQSISISKAGIVTTLQARCAVIAAANPIGGRYDASRTLAENVELTDPILQRFDILCVLQDTVDPLQDDRLARFVTASHMKSTPIGGRGGEENAEKEGLEEDDPMGKEIAAQRGQVIPQDLMKKYLIYARSQVKPRLHTLNQDKIARLYADLRRESMHSGGVPIAVRHIESIMRMSEAHARMHLRDHVREDDVDMAVRTMLESFIQAQKFAVMRTMRRRFHKYIVHSRDHNMLLMHILEDLVRGARLKSKLCGSERDVNNRGYGDIGEDCPRIALADLESRAREVDIFTLDNFIDSERFTKSFRLDKDSREIVLLEGF